MTPSTLLKMLATFLYPTSGRLSVDGLDVVRRPLEVRRKLGYLPGDTPLYEEMRADRFLEFIGRARGLHGDRLREAVKDHPPYVVPCLDMSRATIENENELYLHAIPYMQFPLLSAGRPFTGDYAGVLLFETLHKFGFSTGPESLSADDPLKLLD